MSLKLGENSPFEKKKTIWMRRISFGVVEAGIETGGWTPELRVSRASIDTSIDNLKRKRSFFSFQSVPNIDFAKVLI